MSPVLLLILSFGAVALSSPHPCRRPCETGQTLTCEYDFEVEWYYSMAKSCYDCPFNMTDCDRPHCIPLNGVPRPIAVVNRMLPGPSIEVCQGDQLIVNVKNHLDNGEGVTIHWHGQHMRDSQHMDGTSMITQCPITFGSTFRYEFEAKTFGTHWWHAHSGLQRSDGVFGPMIIRQPAEEDPHSDLYDEDIHTVLMSDWLDEVTMQKFAAHHHDNGDNKPEAMLINGKGKRQVYTRENDDDEYYTSREVYTVESGKRYIFRLMSNAITFCPMQFSVDNHTLLVIASDGAPFDPFIADVLIVYGGESYDVVIAANQTAGNYWLRVKGLGDCNPKSADELAIFRYEGADEEDPTAPESYRDPSDPTLSSPDAPEHNGIILNPFNTEASEREIPISHLNATEPNDITSEKVDVKLYLSMEFNKIDNKRFHHPGYYPISALASHHLYSTQMNDVTFRHASAPLLTQSHELLDGEICTADTLAATNCTEEFCACTHVIEVGLGKVVELVVVDEGVTWNSNHPMHLHGYSFRVVAIGKLGVSTSIEDVMQMDEDGLIDRKLDRPVRKDTVTVPDGGYSVIRFHANNPGWWFFHCHLEFHLEIGMAVVIHVGEDRHLPDTPAGFPRCGNFPQTYTPPPPQCPETSAAIPIATNSVPVMVSLLIVSFFAMITKLV